MSAEAIIKNQARKTLKHNYVSAVIALLIALLPLYMIDGATTAISCAIINLISDEELAGVVCYAIGYPVTLIAGYLLSPVLNGYIRAYYKAAYTDKLELKDVFFYFERGRYGEALRLNLSFILRMLLPSLLFFAPLIIFEVISANVGESFYGSVLYRDCYCLLTVLSSVATTLYSLRYFTVFTVSTDMEQLSAQQAFSYSGYIMQNKTGSAARLIFSFTPWMLLCFLVLPMLYVIPYMTQALCIGAKWMTKATFEVN